MFDMNRIGGKIAELRKQANLTQFALADKLGISFQAVSNWERGVSMPDIAKLPELAEIFGVAVDEILGEKNPLVESAAEGKLAEYVAENPVSPEELAEAAAALPPKELETAIDRREDDLEQLIPCLPYVRTAFVDEVAEKLVRQGKSIRPVIHYVSQEKLGDLAKLAQKQGQTAAEFANCLREDDLRECAFADLETRGVEGIKAYRCHMSEGLVRDLAKYAHEKGMDIHPLIAYLSKEDLRELALKDFAAKGEEGVKPYLSHLEPETISELAKLAQKQGGTAAKFASRLDEASLRECAFADLEARGIEGIKAYRCYMNGDLVRDLAKYAQEKGMDIHYLIVYLPQEDLRELALKDFAAKGVEGVKPYLSHLELEAIGELAKLAQAQGMDIHPFLSRMRREDIRECAFAEYKKKGVAGVVQYLSHMEAEDIEEMLRTPAARRAAEANTL